MQATVHPWKTIPLMTPRKALNNTNLITSTSSTFPNLILLLITPLPRGLRPAAAEGASPPRSQNDHEFDRVAQYVFRRQRLAYALPLLCQQDVDSIDLVLDE